MIGLTMEQAALLRDIVENNETVVSGVVRLGGIEQLDRGFEDEPCTLQSAVFQYATLSLFPVLTPKDLYLPIDNSGFLIFFFDCDALRAEAGLAAAAQNFNGRPFGHCTDDQSMPSFDTRVLALDHDKLFSLLGHSPKATIDADGRIVPLPDHANTGIDLSGDPSAGT